MYVAKVQTAHNRTKRFKTGATNKDDAKVIVEQAGLRKLENAAKAGILTNQVIGHILAGGSLKLNEAVERWLAWAVSIGRSASIRNAYRLEMGAFLRMCKLNNEVPAAITTEHISSFVNAEDGVKYNTRRNRLSVINSFFEFASANGWIMGNPSKLCKVIMNKLTHEQKETGVRHPFNDEEINRVASFCADEMTVAMKELGQLNEAFRSQTDGNKNRTEGGRVVEYQRNKFLVNLFWRTAVLMSRYVGLRLGDICLLEWESIKEPGRITVWTRKTHKRVSLILHPILADAISRVPQNKTKYVFPEQAEERLNTKRRAKLSVDFARLCNMLAIEGKSFHDIRARYIQVCVQEGIPLEQIAKNVGHSDTATTIRYLGEQ